MAKSARSSTKKSNNAKLKSRVFGPVETARTERLSAKLIELISQPKPSEKATEEVELEAESNAADATAPIAKEGKETNADMEVDQQVSTTSDAPRLGKGRIEKRKSRTSKASIVFPKYKNGKRVGMSKARR